MINFILPLFFHYWYWFLMTRLFKDLVYSKPIYIFVCVSFTKLLKCSWNVFHFCFDRSDRMNHNSHCNLYSTINLVFSKATLSVTLKCTTLNLIGFIVSIIFNMQLCFSLWFHPGVNHRNKYLVLFIHLQENK